MKRDDERKMRKHCMLDVGGNLVGSYISNRYKVEFDAKVRKADQPRKKIIQKLEKQREKQPD